MARPPQAPAARPGAGLPPRSGGVPGGKKSPFGPGANIHHPKYGKGIVLRREGEGDDAKLTISFARFGLKKLVQKYAGIKVDE